nr:hypothetical protein [Clavibacter michiganensis]
MPGVQRLPTYAKRAPDASSKSAVAAASPANQLHGGFHELQRTATGSSPVAYRSWSKWWMDMSTSSGCAICSRKPGSWSSCRNCACTTASGPTCATASRNAVRCVK